MPPGITACLKAPQRTLNELLELKSCWIECRVYCIQVVEVCASFLFLLFFLLSSFFFLLSSFFFLLSSFFFFFFLEKPYHEI